MVVRNFTGYGEETARMLHRRYTDWFIEQPLDAGDQNPDPNHYIVPVRGVDPDQLSLRPTRDSIDYVDQFIGLELHKRGGLSRDPPQLCRDSGAAAPAS